jgi:hypothetical protein
MMVAQYQDVGIFEVVLKLSRYMPVWSRGSSGSIVSDYGLDDRAIGVRFPAGAKGFFL